MADVFEIYRARVEKFDRTLGKQHTGAAAATVGFDFQDMVCVIEVLRLAAALLKERAETGLEIDFTVEQNSFDAVDDFVVVARNYRRHLQVKAGADPAWRKRLVDSFWSDHFKYHAAGNVPIILELVVSSVETRDKMQSNLADHHLDMIGVQITNPTANLEKPYVDREVRSLLHRLSLVGGHDGFFIAMFGATMAGWKNAGRRGTIREVFRHVSAASLYTLSSLSKPTEEMTSIVDALNANIEQLRFSADGYSLAVRYKHGLAVTPEIKAYEWRTIFSAFEGGVPRSLLEFQDALGTRRRRNRKN